LFISLSDRPLLVESVIFSTS